MGFSSGGRSSATAFATGCHRSPRRGSMTAQSDSPSKLSSAAIAVVAILAAAVVWSYWTTLGAMVLRWWEDPQYSHGWLVPVFAAYVLWMRREQLSLRTLNVNWLGMVLLGMAAAVRLGGA